MIGNLNLTDQCDVWRATAVPGKYNATKREHQPHKSSVSFRLIEKSKSGFDSLASEFVVGSVSHGLFSIDVDIREGDQVKNVVIDAHGEAETVPGVYQVKGGSNRKRGKTVRIKRVVLQKVS